MILEIEPMDLGQDVRAISLELVDGPDREPVRGADAAEVWSAILPALAGKDPWALDFLSKAERLRAFCKAKGIPFREVSRAFTVLTPPSPQALAELFRSFSSETAGIRAGSETQKPDAALEGELASRGLDAYHSAYPRYSFCGICDLENGSLVLLSTSLWATEVARRLRPAVNGAGIQIQIAH
ncbi:MAG TPA: hypothetical protein VFU57_01965 [Candidatus Acidoferrales bacterium]|nr:hypothetical protein [Candidatus Acidoferrales bacterium]